MKEKVVLEDGIVVPGPQRIKSVCKKQRDALHISNQQISDGILEMYGIDIPIGTVNNFFAERTKAFRMVYPTGFVKTEIITNEDGICIFKAACGYYDGNGNAVILGEGTAREKADTSYINKFSYIENCETSAVGRALGYAGFGIDNEICSQDEINNKGSELLTQMQKEPLPDDAVKPDEKMPLPIAGSWNPRNAITLWCNGHGLKMDTFGKLREALIAGGIVPDIKSGDLTLETFDQLCLAIQQNYPDQLRKQA